MNVKKIYFSKFECRFSYGVSDHYERKTSFNDREALNFFCQTLFAVS